MDQLLTTLSEPWAIRALIASSMIGVMCGMIGCFIVLRNMSLIGDALAHAILPGIFFAFLLVGYSTIGFFVGSVLAGIVAAVGITWIQHNVKTKNDAAIGIVFTAMFSVGVIGISWLNQEEGVHLDLGDFLFGQVLGISNQDIILTSIFTAYTLFSIIVFYRYLFISTFQPTIAQTMGISVRNVHYFLMLMLSFAVVSALSTVGVILVVAMLITPAATALLISNKLKTVLVISAIIGLLSAVIGLIVAILIDMPPGPTMCVVATVFYMFAVLFSPEKGLLARWIRNNNQKTKIIQEDILRQSIKFHKHNVLTLERLQNLLGHPLTSLNFHIKKLSKDGFLLFNNDTVELTIKGVQHAEELVRTHRLWESYQVNTMGLKEGQIHDEADRIEHFLTSEIVDELDMVLGYPEKDPHGSPIPKKQIMPDSLINLRPHERARISSEQLNESIESELWELGLLPGSSILVTKIERDYVEINSNNRTLEIKANLAGKIIVEKK